jgi:lycopene cyclase domain-containing protein
MPVYLITYSVLFWVPALLFIFFMLRTYDAGLRRAFWAACAAMAAASVVMEYLFLKFDVWFFSEKIDRLLGVWIGAAPVEEFVFWFGATPFCLAVYLSYCRLFKKHA